MTVHEKGQAADTRSAACPLCMANFDVMLLELLRTWRELWRQLGALQQVHHAADHGTAGTVAMPGMSRALSKDTMSNSMCPCLAADGARARRAFLAAPALPTMPENHEDHDCE